MRRFRPYLKYLKAVRGSLIAAIVYGLIYGATSGLGLPTLIKYVFPPIFSNDGPPLATSTVLLIAACVPILFLLRALSGYLNSYYVQLTGVQILESIRIDYFSKLQVLPLSFLQRRAAGDLLSRGLADTAQLQFTLTQAANDGVKQPMALLGALGFLVWQAFTTDGVVLVLVCLLIVPLTVFPVRYVGRKIVRRAEQMQARLGGVTSHFSENLAAAREVRAFSLEQRETTRFRAGRAQSRRRADTHREIRASAHAGDRGDFRGRHRGDAGFRAPTRRAVGDVHRDHHRALSLLRTDQETRFAQQ
ncbi:MAG: ABC transporter transmembrane domain-containing protein [Opitutus sp.]|nr:ABC transporter transmembrane domain-containing protein [Opitutus sp.]